MLNTQVALSPRTGTVTLSRSFSSRLVRVPEHRHTASTAPHSSECDSRVLPAGAPPSPLRLRLEALRCATEHTASPLLTRASSSLGRGPDHWMMNAAVLSDAHLQAIQRGQQVLCIRPRLQHHQNAKQYIVTGRRNRKWAAGCHVSVELAQRQHSTSRTRFNFFMALLLSLLCSSSCSDSTYESGQTTGLNCQAQHTLRCTAKCAIS